MATTTTPQTIDRITATRRPSGSPVMKQTWSHLLFLHWRVPASALRPLVPAGLEVDTFEDHGWIGLVPFTVSGARPCFLPPVPFLSSFHEVNVRTYVHRHGHDPGVWFFSLDASNSIVVEAAKRLYRLPYKYAAIDFRLQPAEETPQPGGRPMRIDFSSRRIEGNPPDLEVRYGAGDFPRAAEPGTLEHFLVERYILYAADGAGLYSARVHHAPYPLQAGVVDGLRESLVAAAGVQRPESEPLAHYASGVDVDIWRLQDVV